MSNQGNLSVWNLMSEIIFQSSEVVDCFDESLRTCELGECGFQYTTVHLVLPQVNQLGKMIGSVTKQSRLFMKECEKNLSNTKTKREYITREIHDFCMHTVRTMSHLEVQYRGDVSLKYQNQRIFKLNMYQFDSRYSMSIIRDSPSYSYIFQSGNYENGEQLTCFLNVSDMVKWLMDNLSPHVLAIMTREAPASDV